MLYQEIRREWSPICVLPAHEKKQHSKTSLSVALAVTGAFNASINWKNCNARVSCIPLSRSIFPQISCNKWILCLQCCCSSITMSVIITPLQNKQKKLISRKIYGEWNTFRLDWGESNQITLMFAQTKIFSYSKIQSKYRLKASVLKYLNIIASIGRNKHWLIKPEWDTLAR